MVAQVLETGYTTKNEIVGLIFQVQSGVQQVTFVSAGIVVRDTADVVGTVFFSADFTCVFIRIAALVGIFVVHGKVKLQVFGRQINGTYTSTKLIVRINSFSIIVVFEETSFMVIK